MPVRVMKQPPLELSSNSSSNLDHTKLFFTFPLLSLSLLYRRIIALIIKRTRLLCFSFGPNASSSHLPSILFPPFLVLLYFSSDGAEQTRAVLLLLLTFNFVL